MHVPLISPQQIVLAVSALGIFGLATYGALAGFIPVWVAMLLNLVAVYLSFTPLHDASHRAVSSSPFLNDAIGIITGQLLLPAVNMTVFRAIHMDHHRYTGQEGRDPDTAFVMPPKPFGLFYLMFADVHWVLWYLKHGRHIWSRKVAIYLALLLVTMVAVHVAFLVSPWWKAFLLLYVIPQRVGLGVVAYTFAHIQHPEGLTWDKAPFQSTMYMRGHSPLRRLLFGQEEHIIHHVVPHIPWFKYKRVWDLANGVLKRQEIPSRSWFAGPGEIAVPGPDAQQPIPVRVTAVHDEVPGIRAIALRTIDGRDLPADAGAHVDVHLQAQGMVRQYSVVSAGNGQITLAVKREDHGRGGSVAMHALRVGDTLAISKPRNNFVLYESAPRFLLVAGGIGITALLPMARRLKSLGKPFALHVCARDQAAVPFMDELLRCGAHIHVDTLPGRSSLDPDALLAEHDGATMLYLCGPQGFMASMRAAAARQGWAPAQIRVENFGTLRQSGEEDRPFTVELARSGQQIAVRPEESAIDALAREGIDVPFACMQGTCGTCITSVTHGDIDHRDAYLSEEEKAAGDRMCLCVSRARGSCLTIDL
ncbi:fatty acid desaturase [Aquabacterium sp.]|uniref:fatty acid desaturase n=1 Tax=Aquabacterium sp. TaxID=1872578 RepID=UPI0025C6B540|nr:fatty acid desaturase [Aquabacterium sp.]